jgi:hypothetical protein
MRRIDEKQAGNPLKRVLCPQCRVPYVLVQQRAGWFLSIYDRFDAIVQEFTPYGMLMGVGICGLVAKNSDHKYPWPELLSSLTHTVHPFPFILSLSAFVAFFF